MLLCYGIPLAKGDNAALCPAKYVPNKKPQIVDKLTNELIRERYPTVCLGESILYCDYI